MAASNPRAPIGLLILGIVWVLASVGHGLVGGSELARELASRNLEKMSPQK